MWRDEKRFILVGKGGGGGQAIRCCIQIDGHVSGIICHDGQIHCTISSGRLSVDSSLSEKRI